MTVHFEKVQVNGECPLEYPSILSAIIFGSPTSTYYVVRQILSATIFSSTTFAYVGSAGIFVTMLRKVYLSGLCRSSKCLNIFDS